MKLERGQRCKITDYIDVNQPITVQLKTIGGSVYDSCCFGVDKNNRLSDESYMIFYNQTSSPNGEIKMLSQGSDAKYQIELSRIPLTIDKLTFTVSIDGNGVMSNINSLLINVIQNGNIAMELLLNGSDFQNEKAVIGIEMYRKDTWRLSVVAKGFNGGLGDLLKMFGGVAAEDVKPTQSVQQSSPAVSNIHNTPAVQSVNANPEADFTNKIMNKISLSKDKVNLEKHVVNLSKCVVNLSKKSGVNLGNTRAKVVVILDYSGSMSSLYNNGTVQRTINKLVPLGLTFDDNGSIDLFLFSSNFRKLTDLNLSNYENYVNQIVKKSRYSMGGTSYAPVLKAVIEGYNESTGGFLGFGSKSSFVPPIVDSGDPTFILFITDGANDDRAQTDQIIIRSSPMNVFIQFIGIGYDNFSYLRQLDDIPNRVRDNTGFSKMSDLDKADDTQLYTNVLEQFSLWLKGMQ